MAPVYDPYGRPMPQAQGYGQSGMPQNYGYAAPPVSTYQNAYGAANPYAPSHVPMAMPVAPPTSTATGMFTRNLIGSLTVNAFRLTDTEHKIGFWFILQDLSVRTEGTFRFVYATAPITYSC
jgi:hypothetical protein